MERKTGSIYPLLATYKYGTPDATAKEVSILTADTVYLNYIFAVSYLRRENVYLVFDADLNPCAVRIENDKGEIIDDSWDIDSSLGISELKNIIRELRIDIGDMNDMDCYEMARKLLIKINKRDRVFVPYYNKDNKNKI